MGRGQVVRHGTLAPGSKVRILPPQPVFCRSPGKGTVDDSVEGKGMRMAFAELKVFTGSAHPELAREIASHLGIPLGQARLTRFPDTEVSFQIDENIRGTDVFIVQPT